MSARAAWRLEGLGFTNVYRYTPGKADWAAAGLPVEGTAVKPTRAGVLAQRDAPTCGPSERIGEARKRARDGECAVVNDKGILLGRLGGKALDAPQDAFVEDVMALGPVTTRPNSTAERMEAFFEKSGAKVVWVTTSDGELVGLLQREVVERATRR